MSPVMNLKEAYASNDVEKITKSINSCKDITQLYNASRLLKFHKSRYGIDYSDKFLEGVLETKIDELGFTKYYNIEADIQTKELNKYVQENDEYEIFLRVRNSKERVELNKLVWRIRLCCFIAFMIWMAWVV